MTPTQSGAHILIWDSEHLTPTRERPTTRRPRPKRVEVGTERPRRASTFGTDDGYCHIFVGSPPYRYTSCGQRLNQPVPIEQTHAKPPCPNGNPPCPECVRVREEDES